MAAIEIDWLGLKNSELNLEEIEKHLNRVFMRIKDKTTQFSLIGGEGVVRVKIEIKLVRDKEIIKLKKQFFGQSETTDILSFESDLKTTGVIGSLAISLDQAARQAETAGISLQTEISSLSTHGFLHLLGYHHR